MKFTNQPASQLRYALAFAAGLLLSLAFPKWEWAMLAWLGPGLVLFTSFGQPGGRIIRIGYYAGLSQYLVALYWLLLLPLPLHAVGAWLGVCGFLALYTALWSWVCWQFFPVRVRADSPKQLLQQFFSVEAKRRILWAVSCAAVWVAMEMAICRVFTGFPYSLGVSQFRNLPLIQIASLTGVYGISFLVVWFSIALVPVLFHLVLDRHAFRKVYLDLLIPALAVLLTCGAGLAKLSQATSSTRSIRVALIQPGIPQTVIWNPNEKTNSFKKMVKLSQEALAYKPDLLVWPESALPNLLNRFNQATHDAVTQLAREGNMWMVLGANDVRPKKYPRKPEEVEYLNSSFLIDPSGQLISKYHKRHLVMFGEYMPLGRWLPFLNYFRTLDSGFAPGDGPVPFLLTNLHVKLGLLICSEDVFPHLVRDYVEPDTDVLLNLTNNGWFGESAAQWQHAANAVFRAIENRVPLVRCANNGLTCWVDIQGRMHDVYFPGSKNIYQAGIKISTVPLPDGPSRQALTFYGRIGDIFGWGCVGLTAFLASTAWRKSRREKIIAQGLDTKKTTARGQRQ